MNIFRWIYEQFNPPKTDNQLFEEQAWKNLQYSKSEEGKRHTEMEKTAREIEKNYIDDKNPWSHPF